MPDSVWPWSAGSAPGVAVESGSIAAAAMVPMRPISGLTLPLPSGCKRLLRKTTVSCNCGSIQIPVPVKPPCPNARGENKSPRFDE